MIDEDMKESVRLFLTESYENLDQLDNNFVALEENPGNTDMVSGIFRTIHSIKGTCGFLGFKKLESVAHAGENLLSLLRDGTLTLSPDIITALLKTVDAVREILGCLESTETEGNVDYTELLSGLAALQNQGKDASSTSWVVGGSAAQGRAVPEPRPLGELLVDEAKINPEQLCEALNLQREGDPRRVGEILVEQGAVSPVDVKEALASQQNSGGQGLAVNDSTVRVDVRLLDKLMNLIGELVLSRNQAMEMAAASGNRSMHLLAQKLNRTTSELQEGLMKTRMQPIDTLFGKYPRMIRDLSKACGKEIRLTMEGRDRELDKGLIEALKDPLTHLLRNSIDHGIESPAVRVASGKPAEGNLLIKAYHESGQVVVEIVDDGGGIKLEKVKAKAVEKGLITLDQAAAMSNKEAVNLIFLPGFSTAEQVTNVSGRGVGMDVVASNIKKISGTIDIQTVVGKGTTIKIRIPLTLAILPALIVGCGDQRYAIPQVNLVEIIRLEGETRSNGLESINGAVVFRLRGELLPLVHLDYVLGIAAETDAGLSSHSEKPLQFIVLQADSFRFGLAVDHVMEMQEIVVKPVPKVIMGLQRYSGATMLSNGKVALILDVLGLAHGLHASFSNDSTVDSKPKEGTGKDNLENFLVFRSGERDRLILPLNSVLRVEEFAEERIETTGEWEVLQSQGEILPLLRLDRFLAGGSIKMDSGQSAAPNPDELPLIVCKHRGKTLGLVVNRIVDISRCDASKRADPNRDWILFNLVLSGQVNEMIDLEGIVQSLDEGFFTRCPVTSEGSAT